MPKDNGSVRCQKEAGGKKLNKCSKFNVHLLSKIYDIMDDKVLAVYMPLDYITIPVIPTIRSNLNTIICSCSREHINQDSYNTHFLPLGTPVLKLIFMCQFNHNHVPIKER